MEDFLKNLLAAVAEFASNAGIRIIGALLLLVIGFKLIHWLVKRVKGGKKFASLSSNSRVLIVNLVKVTLYLILVVVIASTLGIETTAITAAIASAGLAVGLALQGSLSNLAGGIMILIFKPFLVGDYIDNGTHSGTVTDIGVFYTTIETVDNKVITIPNGVLSNQSVADYSTKNTRRLDIKISVAYDSDIDLAKKTLLQVASAHQMVLPDPAPFARLGEHGESALVLYLRVWVDSANYWNVYFDLMEDSKKALDNAGIVIPFPQVDVHMDAEK